MTSDSFDISREKIADHRARLNRRVLRERQAERGLAHRRSGGDDDEVGGLEAGGHRVQLGEAGGEPRQHGGAAGHLLNFFEELVGDRLDVREALARALVGEREDHLLGVVEDDGRLVLAFQSLARDLVGDLHELPHQRVVFDDLRVGGDVGEVRQPVGQLGDEGHPAGLLKDALAPQLFAEEQRVDLGAALGEPDHRAEDELVRADVEVLGAQKLDGVVDERVVEEDGAENGALGLGAVGQRALQELFA